MADILQEIKPRLDAEARSALFHVEAQAKQLEVVLLSTRHLLKALLDDKNGVAARLLVACGFPVKTARSYIAEMEETDQEMLSPFASEVAKKARYQEVREELASLLAPAPKREERSAVRQSMRAKYPWYFQPHPFDNALMLAFAEARRTGNSHTIGSGHLLLGLLREPDGFAGATLRSLGLEIDHARQALLTILKD